jgi:hypothetical protein
MVGNGVKCLSHGQSPVTAVQKHSISEYTTVEPCPAQERLGTQQEAPQEKFPQHKWWNPGQGWKATLNNMRLIIQPYVSYCLILPWLHVFVIPFFQEGFEHLVALMNHFKAFTPV